MIIHVAAPLSTAGATYRPPPLRRVVTGHAPIDPLSRGPVRAQTASVTSPPAYHRSSPGRKAALILSLGALAILLLCGGGVTVIGVLAGNPQSAERLPAERPPTETIDAAEPTDAVGPAGAPETPAEPTPAASPTVTAGAPTVSTRTETRKQSIPYGTRTVKDSTLAKGTTKVRTKGVAGSRTLTYEVTYTDGVESGRRLIRQQVTRQPVTKVVAVGTKTAGPRCDPNYSGCVPVASDVDCAGGSGNGPAYVSGVVEVIGQDIYDLDRDGDGYGCD